MRFWRVMPIVLVLLSVPPDGMATDLKDGFMDLAWGAHMNDLAGFKKLGQQLEVSYYVKEDRTYRIDDIDVPNVVYGFYAERFFAVYVVVDAIDVFGRLRKYITEKYGTPGIIMETRPPQTTYTWEYRNVKIKMKHRESEGDMKLAFYYTPLSRKANLAQQEAYVEPPKSFFPLTEEKTREAVEQLDLLNF